MRITLALLALAISLNANSQVLFFECGTGVGSYDMSDFIGIQETSYSSAIPVKIVNNFPATFYFNAEISMRYWEYRIGLNYFFNSTGSRTSYADYSGEVKSDIITTAHSIGPVGELDIYNKNKFSIIGNLCIPVIFTKINFRNQLTIYSQHDTITKSFNSSFLKPRYNSISVAILPGVKARYRHSNFFIDLGLEYLLDLKGKLQNSYLSTNWSGIRLNLNSGFCF